MMVGHAGRQKVRKLRAQKDQFLRELELKYGCHDDVHSMPITNPEPTEPTEPTDSVLDSPSKQPLILSQELPIDEEIISNEIISIITDTKVNLSGNFVDFNGQLENLVEFPLQWERIELVAIDSPNSSTSNNNNNNNNNNNSSSSSSSNSSSSINLKAKLVLERTNIVYEHILLEFNKELQDMKDSTFYKSEYEKYITNSLLLEKKFLSLCSIYLKIFIAREKKIMLLKVDYDNI